VRERREERERERDVNIVENTKKMKTNLSSFFLVPFLLPFPPMNIATKGNDILYWVQNHFPEVKSRVHPRFHCLLLSVILPSALRPYLPWCRRAIQVKCVPCVLILTVSPPAAAPTMQLRSAGLSEPAKASITDYQLPSSLTGMSTLLVTYLPSPWLEPTAGPVHRHTLQSSGRAGRNTNHTDPT